MKPIEYGVPRSPHWRDVEKANKKKACEACGRTKSLEVHHIEPFHLTPEKELDPCNLMTLCRRCHLLIGHLDSWSSYNLLAQGDAREMLDLISRRPGTAIQRS